MARTWWSVRVELLGGRGEQLWPIPGRVLLVGPRHTFAELAQAVDAAFARWDRGHLYEFRLADGRTVGGPDGPDGEPVLDAATAVLTQTVALGAELRYQFDLDGRWMHRCTVGPSRVDPVVELGVVPDRPLPSFGWGDLPDQHGRRWDGDDTLTPSPVRPVGRDPMLAPSWPQVGRSRPRLVSTDRRLLMGATAAADRHAVRELLSGRDPTVLLQHAGDALLAVGLAGLEQAARAVETGLRERGHLGDPELAEVLRARLGGPIPALCPVHVDLNAVLGLASGSGISERGGWLDLLTGVGWPEVILDDLAEADGPDLEQPDRWLYIPYGEPRIRWQDRADFAAAQPQPLHDRLLDDLEGRGAFRRFARLLDDAPHVRSDWEAYEAERGLGRARALLADEGFLALPPIPAGGLAPDGR